MSTTSPIAAYKVMFAGLCSLILTLGIARFAYTPLLPVMMDQTFLDESSGGWLATINYIGYITGALIAASVSDLALKDRLYRWGLVIAIVSTIGMMFAENYLLWSFMRFIAGLSSAAGLLLGSGLILNWLIRHHHRAELGVHFSGLGMGIAITALLCLWMAGRYNWSQQWLVLTGLGLFLFVPSWFWLPRQAQAVKTASRTTLIDSPPARWQMVLLHISYFCAGFAYVISATFLVAMVEKQPALAGNGNLVWLLTGMAAAPACIFWDRVARRTGVLRALMLAFSGNLAAAVLPVMTGSLAGIIIAGLLFGGTFIGIVSLMLTMVGRFYPTKPAKPMGKLTLSYGVAQIIGPAMTGMVVEHTNSYQLPLMIAAGILVVGLLLLWRLQASNSLPETIL